MRLAHFKDRINNYSVYFPLFRIDDKLWNTCTVSPESVEFTYLHGDVTSSIRIIRGSKIKRTKVNTHGDYSKENDPLAPCACNVDQLVKLVEKNAWQFVSPFSIKRAASFDTVVIRR